MRLGVPGYCQGQIVECAYGWLDGDLYMRVHDRSDRETTWYRAADPGEIPDGYDPGGADYPPRVSEWIACEDPREDES